MNPYSDLPFCYLDILTTDMADEVDDLVAEVNASPKYTRMLTSVASFLCSTYAMSRYAFSLLEVV